MTAEEVWARCICVVNGVVIADGAFDARATGGSALCPALAPVANRTLLRRAVDTLVAAGAGDITVVADRQTAPRLRSALAGVGPTVRWVSTPEPPDVASGLVAAADAAAGDRFAVHTTGGLWLQHSDRLRAVSDGDHDALLFLRDVQRVRVAAAESDGEALAVATRPHVGDVSLGGFHAFSGAIVDALRATPGTGEARLLGAVDTVAANGGRVEAAVADGWWSYSGLPDELLAANRIVLDGMSGTCADEMVGDDNRIEGRVEIHPTATVTGSLIRGPVTIGADATVTDAYIGPYTSIGEAATIDNVEIENSVVLTGARVRHVGVRLESSIVGQGASVGRGFDLPRSMRLVIGDDARITLP